MKWTRRAAFWLILVCSGTAWSAENRLGMGVILGDPTGISIQWRTADRQALTGGLAWSFRGSTALHLHGDFLLFRDLSDEVRAKLREGVQTVSPFLHYGIGARFKNAAENKVSLRFPLGITGRFNRAPVDMFVEIVPLLDLVPATEIDLNAAVGARFFF